MLLGRKDAPLQLGIDQVGELVEYLQTWLERGQFKPTAGRVVRVDAASADVRPPSHRGSPAKGDVGSRSN